MTYNTKNTIGVFVFAAILMGMPFAAQNAYAADIVISGTCGVTVTGGSAGIDFGTLAPSAESTEITVTVVTDGTVSGGNFQISATDWTSIGTTSTGFILLDTVIATDTVTINSITFTANALGGTQDTTNFIVGANDGSDDVTTAAALATSINANGSVDVTALASEDSVLLRSGTVDSAGEYGTTTADSTFTMSASTLTGSTSSGATIIQAELTKFDVTNTGTAPVTSTYASKTALNIAGVNDIIISGIDVGQDVILLMQVITTLDDTDFVGGVTQTLTFNAVCV